MKNQRKFKTLFKRLMSGVSALALSVGLLGSIPASADDSNIGYKYTLFAYSSEEGAITSSAANFCVNGNIATNGTISAGQNFNVNGEKKEHANETMPDLSKAINEEFFAENVDVKAENYKNEDVNINVPAPLDVKGKAELNGNIKLAAGIKAMGDIVLAGGVLNNDSTVLFSEKGNIVINSENVSLTGLIYAPKGNIVIESKSLNLNSVVMIANKITLNAPNVNINNSASMAKFVQEAIDKNNNNGSGGEEKPVTDPAIYAYGEYNEETKSVDIEWYSNVTGEFAVLESMNGTEYTLVSKVSDNTKYSINVASDFIKKYFKVTTIKDGKTIESIPFSIVNANGKYTTELLDTDKDGLADLYEEMLGTDKTVPDTDKDGLTDYEEAYITNTDPTKYDSVTDGVSDADADNDKDGLSNKREIELKTDPNSDDTDSDTLKDGDEVSKYNTDPLKPDTDGDGINDGDEVLLKLDPTNPVTNGVKDSEHYFEQEIPADSKVFSQINTENSPYALSMKINCTGYAESNVTACESSYHSAIESDMTVGTIADISLNEACKSKEIVLYYKINGGSQKADSTKKLLRAAPRKLSMQDIGKYVVFTFDNKLNSIVPVLTKYDYENNAVYASVDHEGTYFIADLEKWKESIQDISVKDYSDMQEGTEKADVVFSVNISGGITAEEDLKKMKDNILRNVEKLFEENNDIRVSVIGYSQKFIDGSHCQHTYLDQLNKKEEWATKVQDVITLLSQLKVDNSSSKGYLEYGTQDISYPFIGAGVPCDYREDADKYAFVYTLSSKMGTHYLGSLTGYSYARICPMGTILERMSARSIKLSFVFEQDMSDTGFAQFMKEKADGTYIMYTPDEKGKQPMGVYDYVKQNTKFSNGSDIDPTHGRTMFISSLSLKPITLSAPLYANGKNDTDSDGLTDWEEVRKNIEGFPVPMMIESSTDKYGYTGIPKFVDALMCRTHSADDPIFEFLKSKLGSDYDDIMQLPCLILNSDPTNPDSDGDNCSDPYEINVSKTDPLEIDTDKDGMDDYLDDFPLEYNKEGTVYNRKKAVEYAQKWYIEEDGYDPNYFHWRYNCTGFASQCIQAGGMKPTVKWKCVKDTKTNSFNESVIKYHYSLLGYYYDKSGWMWSDSWCISDKLFEWLDSNNCRYKNIAYRINKSSFSSQVYYCIINNLIKPGDLLFFSHSENGKYTHTVFVESIDKEKNTITILQQGNDNKYGHRKEVNIELLNENGYDHCMLVHFYFNLK